MKVMALGLDYSTGFPLYKPVDEQDLGKSIENALTQNINQIRALATSTTYATTFRGEVERQPVDLGNARSAGWTFLVNSNDPRRDVIIQTIRPLAEHRGMENPATPLLFNNEGPDEWFDWLGGNYLSPDVISVPHYILLIGSPDQVPFGFQSLLGAVAAVGRLDFDTLDDLKVYVEKIIRLEKAVDPLTTREVLFFAPDYGPHDPTYFSRRYMVEPLAEYVKALPRFNVQTIMGDHAIKERLLASLRRTRPALVYTASHGLGAPLQSFEIQKRVNGAICCQRTKLEQRPEDWLFMADDVVLDEPFLEGAVFFQFACFGYGTPAESDFAHWDPSVPRVNAQTDFIAALPKRLLAHAEGPVAYVGHVDTAWLHGFDNPDSPLLLERWHPRIEPFVRMVDTLLKVEPVGLAMAGISKRYGIGNVLLTSTYDRLKRRKLEITPEVLARLVSMFITRSDAQNYMIFGDPAVRLRIPDQ